MVVYNSHSLSESLILYGGSSMEWLFVYMHTYMRVRAFQGYFGAVGAFLELLKSSEDA